MKRKPTPKQASLANPYDRVTTIPAAVTWILSQRHPTGLSANARKVVKELATIQAEFTITLDLLDKHGYRLEYHGNLTNDAIAILTKLYPNDKSRRTRAVQHILALEAMQIVILPPQGYHLKDNIIVE